MIGALVCSSLVGLQGLLISLIGPIVLWSGEPIKPDEVASVGPQGITLSVSFDSDAAIGQRSIIGWGAVKEIQGGWGEARAYREVSVAIRIAEQRLARGDTYGAGLALRSVSEPYRTQSGPTSSQILSALVLIDLFRGEREAAIENWISTIGDAPPHRRSWIDSGTRLCVALPPVFSRDESIRFLEKNPEASQDVVQSGAWDLYIAAARIASKQPAGEIELAPRAKSDPGVRLLMEIVQAQSDPELAGRRAARQALARRSRSTAPAWEQVWSRLGMGVSLMGESDMTSRDAGAAKLISVLVELPNAAPGLAELTRDLLVEYFTETDRPGHVDAVRTMERASLLGIGLGVMKSASAPRNESGNLPGSMPPDEEGTP